MRRQKPLVLQRENVVSSFERARSRVDENASKSISMQFGYARIRSIDAAKAISLSRFSVTDEAAQHLCATLDRSEPRPSLRVESAASTPAKRRW
jgi:hypothetical protein